MWLVEPEFYGAHCCFVRWVGNQLHLDTLCITSVLPRCDRRALTEVTSNVKRKKEETIESGVVHAVFAAGGHTRGGVGSALLRVKVTPWWTRLNDRAANKALVYQIGYGTGSSRPVQFLLCNQASNFRLSRRTILARHCAALHPVHHSLL